METEHSQDVFFMQAAISEARAALDEYETPIGAVVVCRGRIVGRGHNRVEAFNDSTAHAEMQALSAAENTLGSKYLDECTLYVTVEPCVMCAGALFWCRIGRVVYGTSDPKRGNSLYSPRLYHPKTVVENGVLEDDCAALMSQFFKKLR